MSKSCYLLQKQIKYSTINTDGRLITSDTMLISEKWLHCLKWKKEGIGERWLPSRNIKIRLKILSCFFFLKKSDKDKKIENWFEDIKAFARFSFPNYYFLSLILLIIFVSLCPREFPHYSSQANQYFPSISLTESINWIQFKLNQMESPSTAMNFSKEMGITPLTHSY